VCSASREGELVETFLARSSDKSTEAVRAGFLARERAQGQSMAGEVASVAIVSRIVNVGTSRIHRLEGINGGGRIPQVRHRLPDGCATSRSMLSIALTNLGLFLSLIAMGPQRCDSRNEFILKIWSRAGCSIGGSSVDRGGTIPTTTSL